MHSRTRRPSPALIISIIALVASLTGTAFAAQQLAKNSVGSRQIKAKAVTTGKIAPNAVNGSKVANESVTAEDIRISSLQNVPSAQTATNANNANTVGAGPEKHGAECPAGTTLIRGICFDVTLSGPVAGVEKAATACAQKGGFLPTPMQLYTARTVIFLGSGTPPDYAVADQYYFDDFDSMTVVIDGSGTIKELPTTQNTKYICAYQLVR
jgi:hypothetical protein